MARPTAVRNAALASALSLTAIPAFGADDSGQFDIGAHFGTMLGDGVPANDMPGYGIYGLYRLNERWSVGLGIDRTDFDYEEPARILGIPLDPDDPPVDPKAEMTIYSALIERTFDASREGREWFLGAAIGVADTDVPDVTGPTATGGTFDIDSEVDRELIISLRGGVRQHFGERWFMQFSLRAEQHFAAWELEDRISGATGRHEDYFAYGGFLGIGYRF
jgi:hypothetical protein